MKTVLYLANPSIDEYGEGQLDSEGHYAEEENGDESNQIGHLKFGIF